MSVRVVFKPCNYWSILHLFSVRDVLIIDYQQKFLLNLFSFHRQYYREDHPLFGIHYMKLGKINLYLKKFSEALCMLKNAEKVIRVTHGERHSLYQDQLLPLVHQTQAELDNT